MLYIDESKNLLFVKTNLTLNHLYVFVQKKDEMDLGSTGSPKWNIKAHNFLFK